MAQWDFEKLVSFKKRRKSFENNTEEGFIITWKGEKAWNSFEVLMIWFEFSRESGTL